MRALGGVSRRISLGIALAALGALVACGSSEPPPSAAADGWHDFSGSWNAAGTRHTIPLGGERRAALLDLSGSLALAGPSRPAVGFRSQAVALNDTESGLVGRSVWTDQNGDQVFSELHGQGVAAGNKISGTFIGGTGRYAGATGSYEFTWQYVLEAEDGSVQGRAIGLAGRVRVAPTQPSRGTPEAKP